LNVYLREDVEKLLTKEILAIEDTEDTVWVVEGYDFTIKINYDHIFYKSNTEIVENIMNKLATGKWINKRERWVIEKLVCTGMPHGLEIIEKDRFGRIEPQIIGDFLIGMRKTDWDKFDNTETGADKRGDLASELITSLMQEVLTDKELLIIEQINFLIYVGKGKHEWKIYNTFVNVNDLTFTIECRNDQCNNMVEESIDVDQLIELNRPSIMDMSCEDEDGHDLQVSLEIDDAHRTDYIIYCEECARESEQTLNIDTIIRYFGLPTDNCQYYYDYIHLYYASNRLELQIKLKTIIYNIKIFFTERIGKFFTEKIPTAWKRFKKGWKAFWRILKDG
jgi:hypothetical protein